MARRKTKPPKSQARAGNRKGVKPSKEISLTASDKNSHTDDTIGLQERALVLYKECVNEG